MKTWYSPKTEGQPLIIEEETGRTVAIVMGFSDDENVKQEAKIIAAAPDLLDACKRVNELYSEVERMVDGEVKIMLEAVRNAINKATE